MNNPEYYARVDNSQISSFEKYLRENNLEFEMLMGSMSMAAGSVLYQIVIDDSSATALKLVFPNCGIRKVHV